MRVDNGPEFVSKELDLWAFMRGVMLDFRRPGKATHNAFIESLNGKCRAECMTANWFLSLNEARRKCEARRRDYDEGAPHRAIGNQVPAMKPPISAARGPRSGQVQSTARLDLHLDDEFGAASQRPQNL